MMTKLLMTVRLTDAEADLRHAQEQLQLRAGEIDEAFGLVPIDPAQNLYSVLVDEAAATRSMGLTGNVAYANPVVEPFDTPEPPAPKQPRRRRPQP